MKFRPRWLIFLGGQRSIRSKDSSGGLSLSFRRCDHGLACVDGALNTGNRVSVVYVEGGSTRVEEIGITMDARHAPEELLEKLGDLASRLRCVFLTVHTAEIVQPDKPSLLRALKESTANKFLDDPEATLKGLDCGVFEIDSEPKN